MKIIVETSARHVHLLEQDFFKLFGNNVALTKKKDLSQPGEFLCFEKVAIVGPKNTIQNVSIIGPLRKSTQVEVSLTDARKLGINAPIRESGKIENSAGCKIIGPKGEIEIHEGVIVAQRHIHLTPDKASELNLQNNELVSVKIDSNERSLIFGDVVVRISEKFNNAIHIDTDESNAAGIQNPCYGEILK